MILKCPHLLELLLHSSATFGRQLEKLSQLLLRVVLVRVDKLEQARKCLPHSLHVACVEVTTQREVAVQRLRQVVSPQLFHCLGEIVHHEPVVVSEELVPHLRDLPAWEVKVKP